MNTLVLKKYPFELLPLSGKSPLSYWQYIGDAHKHNVCFGELIKGMPEGVSVVENFGGIGMTGTIVQNELKPSLHVLFDIDEDCIKQLQHLFQEKVRYGDAKETIGMIQADFVILDFPNFTVNKWAQWEEPFRRMFNLKPKFVTITDIANQRIGLHRDLYTKIFQAPIFNIEDYMEALSQKFYDSMGYSIQKVAYDHKAAFLLLTARVPGSIDFWKYPGGLHGDSR